MPWLRQWNSCTMSGPSSTVLKSKFGAAQVILGALAASTVGVGTGAAAVEFMALGGGTPWAKATRGMIKKAKIARENFIQSLHRYRENIGIYPKLIFIPTSVEKQEESAYPKFPASFL